MDSNYREFAPHALMFDHRHYKKTDSLYIDNQLKITGGTHEGDSENLTLAVTHSSKQGRDVVYPKPPNGTSASYVHIEPTSEAKNQLIAGFSDVTAVSRFAEAVKWAVNYDIANGISATTFGAQSPCTVSHILTFLWRVNERPGAGNNERAAVTAWAKGLGIDISNMSAPCTRAMAVQYMWIAAGKPTAKETVSFTDVADGSKYAQAVAWAVEEGITSGTSSSTFSPNNTCTRGQIVTFLYRARDIYFALNYNSVPSFTLK